MQTSHRWSERFDTRHRLPSFHFEQKLPVSRLANWISCLFPHNEFRFLFQERKIHKPDWANTHSSVQVMRQHSRESEERASEMFKLQTYAATSTTYWCFVFVQYDKFKLCKLLEKMKHKVPFQITDACAWKSSISVAEKVFFKQKNVNLDSNLEFFYTICMIWFNYTVQACKDNSVK